MCRVLTHEPPPRRRTARGMACTALLVAALLLPGCAANTPVKAPELKEVALPPLAPQPYRLRVNDVVNVKFWNSPELNDSVRIRPDGMISLPHVDDVAAAGLTPSELDRELVKRYSAELANPDITVIVVDTESVIYVGGEVGRRGSLPLEGTMTLFEAIQASGGFLNSARRKQVLLVRIYPDGSRVARSIDVRPMQSGRDFAHDVVLQPFDIVFVPRARIDSLGLFIDKYINQILPVQAFANAYFLEQLRTADQENAGGGNGAGTDTGGENGGDTSGNE